MALALSRPQIRDRIRRTYLGITPPADPQVATGLPVPGAKAGDAPLMRPDPSNPLLNDCIELAITDLNSECDFTENLTTGYPVEGVGAGHRGPLTIPLQSFLGQNALLSDIRRVVWSDPSTPSKVLAYSSWQEEDRLAQAWDTLPAGVPHRCLIQAWQLAIIPAPVTSGTLTILAGTAPFAPVTESDTIQQLPVEYHESIYVGAARRFLQGRAEDAEARAKLEIILPQWQSWVARVLAWKNTKLISHQQSFGFASYRQGSGLRRNRR